MKYTRYLLLPVFLIAWTAPSLAGNHNQVLSIGDPAPDWSLPGVDGKTINLADLSQNKLTVMIFTCVECPAARNYIERMKQFTKDYQPRGVEVVAIHVHRDETLQDAAEQSQSNDFNFPYLHDESQRVAKAYGALTTPHVFVLDQEHKIAFMGAFDDNLSEKRVDKAYLRNAVDALLADKKPSLAETRPFGCSIKSK